MNNRDMQKRQEGGTFKRKICASLVIFFLIPAFSAAALDLAEIPPKIPLQTKFYTIRSAEAAAEPGILKFGISSPNTVYTVEGFLPLMKVLKEIEIIELVKEQERNNGFFSGAVDSVESTAVGLGNLVGHPIDSAKGIGKAAGKWGRSLGGVFQKKEEGEKISLGEKVMGSMERETAAEMGADIYTRNPNLRNLIERISKARMGGRGAVIVLTLIVPIAAIASVAISAGSLNSAADEIVNDTDRAELYRINKEAFLAMGYRLPEVLGFLNRDDLTPREQTYFRFYLDALKNIEGSGQLFESMQKTRSGWEALRKLYEVQMAAGSKSGTIAKLWSYPEGIAALERSGRMIFFTAFDELNSGDLENRIFARIQFLRAQNRVPVEIRNGGSVTGSFKAQAHRNGIGVKPWCYFDTKERYEKT